MNRYERFDTEQRSGGSEKKAYTPVPFICAADLSTDPPPREFLVEPLIPAGTVTLISGDGGVGKSLLVKQLAVASVLGRFWLGRQVNGGRTMFVTAEDDRDEVNRRLVDICRSEGVQIADLIDLDLWVLAGEDAVLGAYDGKAIVPTERFRGLERRIAMTAPSVIILDTLADIFGGDEIRRDQARQFIGMLRGLAIKHGLTVIVLAHPSVAGMASGTGASGSTAWNNSVRSRLYFERVKGEGGTEDDPDRRTLRTVKSNYGRTGEAIPVRWTNGVFALEGAAGGGFDFRRIAEQQRADEVFLKLLAAYSSEGRSVSPNPSASYAPTMFAKDERAKGMTKAGFAAAMNRLFEAKKIRVEDHGPASKTRARIVASSTGSDQ